MNRIRIVRADGHGRRDESQRASDTLLYRLFVAAGLAIATLVRDIDHLLHHEQEVLADLASDLGLQTAVPTMQEASDSELEWAWENAGRAASRILLDALTTTQGEVVSLSLEEWIAAAQERLRSDEVDSWFESRTGLSAGTFGPPAIAAAAQFALNYEPFAAGVRVFYASGELLISAGEDRVNAYFTQKQVLGVVTDSPLQNDRLSLAPVDHEITFQNADDDAGAQETAEGLCVTFDGRLEQLKVTDAAQLVRVGNGAVLESLLTHHSNRDLVAALDKGVIAEGVGKQPPTYNDPIRRLFAV